jgi:2-oxoisovalerate dehydrogenase E1 component subunit alpha
MRKVAEFVVSSTGFIAAYGATIDSLPPFARDPSELTAFYRAMVLTRAFDAKAVALQRTGRLGQKAVSIGVAAAMQLLPSFREHGAQIWRGVNCCCIGAATNGATISLARGRTSPTAFR